MLTTNSPSQAIPTLGPRAFSSLGIIITTTGVIAQEIEQEFPELVNTDSDGFKSVSYEGIAPILIEAVKELKAEKDELQTKVDHQQQQIDELKRLVEELMKK